MQYLQDRLAAGGHTTLVSPASAGDLAKITARRAAAFRQHYPGVPYPAAPTAADTAGTTLVLRLGLRIAGAIRLNTARLGTDELLPSESPTWRIDAAAPFLVECGGGLRGEIGGLFVDTDHVTPDQSIPLYAAAVDAARRASVSQLVIFAPPPNLRLYRWIGRAVGCEVVIRPEVDTTEPSRRYGAAMGFAYSLLNAAAVAPARTSIAA